MILSARILLGWIDPSDVEVTNEITTDHSQSVTAPELENNNEETSTTEDKV